MIFKNKNITFKYYIIKFLITSYLYHDKTAISHFGYSYFSAYNLWCTDTQIGRLNAKLGEKYNYCITDPNENNDIAKKSKIFKQLRTFLYN